MSSADDYRKKAAECEVFARADKDFAARIEWLNMAKGYRRLADLAEKNARTDVVYEPPMPQQQTATTAREIPQQQQQPQAKPDEDKV